MKNFKISVKPWVCDSGIYCEHISGFVGNPLSNSNDAVVIMRWLNGLNEADITTLFMNHVKVKRDRESDFATRITTKLKGC